MEGRCFPFGSRRRFPYMGMYLTAVASGHGGAAQGSGGKYPDVSGGLNGSSCYSEEGWGHAIKPSRDCRPAETIWKEARFGQRPEGYGDLFLYVLEAGQIIRIAEGTGDNLLEEDMDAGYVDYIYYDQYMLDIDMPNIDGGMVLLDGMLREKYSCLADCIPDVLVMAYGSCPVGYIILG